MGTKNLNPIDITENNSGRFMSLSVLIHATMLASVALMGIPPSSFTPRDVVEFELESDVPAMIAIPDGADELPQKATATTAVSAPIVTKTIAPEPIAPAVAEVPVVAEAPKISAPVKTAAAAPVRASAPATLDDIQAPDLETSEFGEVAVAQMNEKDFQEDFEKIDNENHKALAAVKNSLEKDADNAAAEGDNAFAEVALENKAQAKAIADALEARRAKDAAAIAAAKASEKAAAQTAALLAAKEAAAREAQEAALKAESGEGSGNSGSPEPTIKVAGIPGGVRALDQLRQMPGNKFPQYSSDERLARQEGKAMFYAYVNKDGSLSRFKLGQTTGHRNLDSKTLSALKRWKFYPGQEGWVEMPFQWSLTGDAREAGGTLRK